MAKVDWAEMLPYELAAAIATAPVCYLPLGTLEFHGWHLPLGFDALKAQAICRRCAQITGGVVMPPNFWGIGGGHKGYAGSAIADDDLLPSILRNALREVRRNGFKVAVVLTGHYPGEQVIAVKAASAEAGAPDFSVIALPEHEAFPTETRGDHAAKWETSLGLALFPEQVEMDRLTGDNPLYGIYGQDPRMEARAELGLETVEVIVNTIADRVRSELKRLGVA
ncbi:MAG: creatininase family protein [Anaerolineae bacterium]|nr:creatininase family protein [Anaerolineae bacterium]